MNLEVNVVTWLKINVRRNKCSVDVITFLKMADTVLIDDCAKDLGLVDFYVVSTMILHGLNS